MNYENVTHIRFTDRLDWEAYAADTGLYGMPGVYARALEEMFGIGEILTNGIPVKYKLDCYTQTPAYDADFEWPEEYEGCSHFYVFIHEDIETYNLELIEGIRNGAV